MLPDSPVCAACGHPMVMHRAEGTCTAAVAGGAAECPCSRYGAHQPARRAVLDWLRMRLRGRG